MLQIERVAVHTEAIGVSPMPDFRLGRSSAVIEWSQLPTIQCALDGFPPSFLLSLHVPPLQPDDGHRCRHRLLPRIHRPAEVRGHRPDHVRRSHPGHPRRMPAGGAGDGVKDVLV